MKIKRYQTSSSHSVGYAWGIKAPEELPESEVMKVVEALAEWSDAPSMGDLLNIIEDAEFYDLDPKHLGLVERIAFTVEVVHREQDINILEEINE